MWDEVERRRRGKRFLGMKNGAGGAKKSRLTYQLNSRASFL